MKSVVGTLTWMQRLIDDGLTVKQLRRKVDNALRDMRFLQQMQKKQPKKEAKLRAKTQSNSPPKEEKRSG